MLRWQGGTDRLSAYLRAEVTVAMSRWFAARPSRCCSRLSVVLAGLAFVALLVVLDPSSVAHAATFEVNSTADTADPLPNNGICDVDAGTPGNQCTLRAAIQSANGTGAPGADIITFNIPGLGVQTISPASALPAITGQVLIDGYTQPGASVNTLAVADNAVLLIELNGAGAVLVRMR